MRIIRFATGRTTRYGIFEDNIIRALRGSPFAPTFNLKKPPLDSATYSPDEVKLLAPCAPSKLVCLGLNYHKHAEEFNQQIPSVPLIFLKPSTSVIGPDEEIVLPYLTARIDYEGELGAVIGKRAKNVPQEKVRDYILGYTCVNDVTERHAQKEDVQWTRSKSFDTFAPIGPWIETDVEPDDLEIQTRLNGELRQSARTSDLIFSVPKVVSFISSIMTLLPGDVIPTGTPSGIGRIKPDDVVEVCIEKIGTLRNPVSGPK
ncbi:MAG: fumarylacetoacetate hydrolase family protein [Chloroflexi bacterium]|nr:fumarylacetoacetate hydrolase family protein [Chloroflexota bacterium]